MKRAGRRPEPDQLSRSFEIAARVYERKSADRISLNNARKEVAAELQTSIDTVKRAFRLFKSKPIMVSTEALVLHIQLDTNPKAAGKRARNLKDRIAIVKKNRGKHPKN